MVTAQALLFMHYWCFLPRLCWIVLVSYCLGSPSQVGAQAAGPPRTPADFGYQHLLMRFGADSIHLLVLSAPGEAQVRKPLPF